MKRSFTAALPVVAILFFASPAHADLATCSKPLETHYSAEWHAVKHMGKSGKLRKNAQGRNIRRWGVLGTGPHHKVRPARCHELRRSLAQLRRLRAPVHPLLVRTAVPPRQRPAGTLTASVSAGPTLEAIAQCESGGNPATNTGNGFYGKYQFTQSTWESVGGSGNPAAASEAEQNQRAAMLYAREGAAPWPVCGR
jgi:transglycosylase-like protein